MYISNILLDQIELYTYLRMHGKIKVAKVSKIAKI